MYEADAEYEVDAEHPGLGFNVDLWAYKVVVYPLDPHADI